MPNNETKIVITGDASSAAAATKQAGEGMRQLKVDTSDLSEETRRQMGFLDLTTKEMKKIGDQGKKTAEGFRVRKDEASELGKQLGKLTGISDLEDVFSRFGAASTLAAKSIEFLKGTIEAMRDTINGPVTFELHDDPAQIEAAAKSWNQYADARKKVTDALNSPETGAADVNKDLQNELQLLQNILKAEEKEQLAHLSTKKDQMTPQAYAAEEARIKANFANREGVATNEERQNEIINKRKEAHDLEADAEKKKQAAETMSTGNADAQGAAKANAENAKAALQETEQTIEFIKRVQKGSQGEDVPEYEELGGTVTEYAESFDFMRRYGYGASIDDALKIEEQRKAQEEAQIALGVRATEQAERLGKKKSELLTEAGDESGKAEVLNHEADREQAGLDAKRQNERVASTLDAAARAQAQGASVGDYNTPQGFADAFAARQSATQSLAQLNTVLRGLTDTHTEAYNAIIQAIADLKAENQKITAKLQQSQYNNQ